MRPALREALRLPNVVGVTGVVAREAPIASVAQQTDTPRFRFISVGTPAPDPAQVTLGDAWSSRLARAVR